MIESTEQDVVRKQKELKLVGILVLVLALLTLLVISSFRIERGDHSSPAKTAHAPFPEVEIEAEAVYIYDVRTQEVIYAKNHDKRLPLASLTKVMTALVARELGSEGDKVVVTGEALSEVGNNGLYRDERWNLGDLLDFSLISSSNDGARAVALALSGDQDFIQVMNEKARELGLKNTYFLNETGLDLAGGETGAGGAYGSAEDLARLLEYVMTYHPEILEGTRHATTTLVSESGITHTVSNTNVITDKLPGLLASKTGFTGIAGGALAVVIDPELGRPIIIVVMGSSEKGRFRDVETLSQAVMQYITGGDTI